MSPEDERSAAWIQKYVSSVDLGPGSFLNRWVHSTAGGRVRQDYYTPQGRSPACYGLKLRGTGLAVSDGAQWWLDPADECVAVGAWVRRVERDVPTPAHSTTILRTVAYYPRAVAACEMAPDGGSLTAQWIESLGQIQQAVDTFEAMLDGPVTQAYGIEIAGLADRTPAEVAALGKVAVRQWCRMAREVLRESHEAALAAASGEEEPGAEEGSEAPVKDNGLDAFIVGALTTTDSGAQTVTIAGQEYPVVPGSVVVNANGTITAKVFMSGETALAYAGPPRNPL